MPYRTKIAHYLTSCVVALTLSACENVGSLSVAATVSEDTASSSEVGSNSKMEQAPITDWETLVPVSYRAEAILEKYGDVLNNLEDNDPSAWEAYEKMQTELETAPIDSTLDQRQIELEGFIAPLTFDEKLITEFLFVPYVGACMHVPPPPLNQIILVKAAEGQDLTEDSIYEPIVISGQLQAKSASTELAEAGYQVQNAKIYHAYKITPIE